MTHSTNYFRFQSTTRPRLEHIEIADVHARDRVGVVPSRFKTFLPSAWEAIISQSSLSVNSISIGSHHPSLHPFSAIDSIDSQLHQLIFFQEQSITSAISNQQSPKVKNIATSSSTQLNPQIIQTVLLHHVLQRHWKCISIVYHRRMSLCGKSRKNLAIWQFSGIQIPMLVLLLDSILLLSHLYFSSCSSWLYNFSISIRATSLPFSIAATRLESGTRATQSSMEKSRVLWMSPIPLKTISSRRLVRPQFFPCSVDSSHCFW